MPVIRLETNMHIPEERVRPLTAGFAAVMATLTGEPKGTFSGEVAGNRRMRMATSDEPIAHVEIRGTEFPKERADELAAALCALIDEQLSINEENVYIAVISDRMSMWRVHGGKKNERG